jgi:hypothetical protein
MPLADQHAPLRIHIIHPTRIPERCAHPRPSRCTSTPAPNKYWVWHPRPSCALDKALQHTLLATQTSAVATATVCLDYLHLHARTTQRQPTEQGGPHLYWIRKWPFFGRFGCCTIGVVLGVVLGSPPVGGVIFLRAIAAIGRRPGRANSDHGPRKTGGQQSKDEIRGDKRGKQTHDLANPRERGRSKAPPSSLL